MTDQMTTPPDPQEQNTSTNKRDDAILISRVTLNYLIIAIVFFAIGLVTGIISIEQKPSTSNDVATERIVRSLLEDAGVLKPLQNMSVLIDDDPSIGDADAPIVIVEFSAYACPYCGRFHNETLPSILENYGEHILYVYRDFPSINPEISYAAAIASNCALDQEQYWEYQEILFQNQELLGPSYYMQVAEELELDMDAFGECYLNQDSIDEIEADFQDAIAVGVSGTPSFYINGLFYSGARPYSFFEGIILRELEKAGVDPRG